MNRIRLAFIAGMVFTVVAFRLLPHPPNLVPVVAMALFGGASFASRSLALAVPLVAMAVSDALLALFLGVPFGLLDALFVYGSLLLVASIGLAIRGHRGVLPIALGALSGSVLFFVLTNFGVWAFGSMYAQTLDGLWTCYVMALPFFRNELLATAAATPLFFGGLALADRLLPALRKPVRSEVAPGREVAHPATV